MPVGSLNSVLHGGKGIPVVDDNAIKKFAVDIARGMKFLHDMQVFSLLVSSFTIFRHLAWIISEIPAELEACRNRW